MRVFQAEPSAGHKFRRMLIARIDDGHAVDADDEARPLRNDGDLAPFAILHRVADFGDLFGARQRLDGFQSVPAAFLAGDRPPARDG